MPTKTLFSIVPLSEMQPSQEADTFVLLAAKEELTTREGKPYYKVTFRDHAREVAFPIWQDSPWGNDCRENWQPGTFYKVRAVYRETTYGPQLDIRKIRAVVEADTQDGFQPQMCLAQSQFSADEMFDELCSIASQQILEPTLRDLTLGILERNRQTLLTLPAATHNHHAFVGGFLEHVLSVTRTCIFLADKYGELYEDMQPPLSRDLVIAGGILHDIGKLREIEEHATGAAIPRRAA